MTSSVSEVSPTRSAALGQASGEGREGPVREKLEETRIDEQKRQSLELIESNMKEVPGSSDGRGRLRKKRSLDDTQETVTSNEARHTRKRSRELEEKQRPAKKEKGELDELISKPADESTAAASAPPDELVQDPLSDERAAQDSHATNTTAAAHNQEATSPSTPPKIPATSGFANASAKSPFASLDAGKSPFSSVSGSTAGGGFASSGFASFSKASSSPFSALSPSKQATAVSTTDEESTRATGPAKESLSFTSSAAQPSGFGALAGQKKSVFGGSSGDASPFAGAGTGGGNSPFKSFGASTNNGVTNGLSGAKSVKVGDDAASDGNSDDGGGAEDDDTAAVGAETEERQDERFYEQDVETGEEGEQTMFQNRAKLYYMPEGAWKERGVGVFKVNCKKLKSIHGATDGAGADGDGEQEADPEAGKVVSTDARVAARFIFRSDGNHRTMLNSPVTKEVVFKERPGEQNGKSRIFTGYVDGKPAPFLITMKLPSVIQDLVEVVEAIKEKL